MLSFARSPSEMNRHLGSPYIPWKLLKMRPRKDSGGSTFVHKSLISVSFVKEGAACSSPRGSQTLLSAVCVSLYCMYITQRSGHWELGAEPSFPLSLCKDLMVSCLLCDWGLCLHSPISTVLCPHGSYTSWCLRHHHSV